MADSDHGKGSPIGLFVVLILVVATYLLYRSMSRHLRRVPEHFPGDQPEAGSAERTEVDGAGPETPEVAAADAPATEGSAPEASGAAGTGSRLGTQSGERTGPS